MHYCSKVTCVSTEPSNNYPVHLTCPWSSLKIFWHCKMFKSQVKPYRRVVQYILWHHFYSLLVYEQADLGPVYKEAVPRSCYRLAARDWYQGVPKSSRRDKFFPCKDFRQG